MSITRHTAKTHPHYQGYDESVDDRGTLPETFDPLNDRFEFTIDVAASRLRFLLPGERLVSPYSRPPFGNVLLIWNADRKAPGFRQQPSLDLIHKAEGAS